MGQHGKPRIGDDALSVVRYICEHQGIAWVRFKRHDVGENWRQKYADSAKLDHVDAECFKHNDAPGVIQGEMRVTCEQLRRMQTEDLQKQCRENQVYSACSRVVNRDGNVRHLTMMNFHPQEGGLEFVIKTLEVLRQLRPDLVSPGVVLSTGRYWHYYGYGLLTPEEYVEYLSYFLMPAILVSPRYIGHRLYEKEGMLRVTGGVDAKPKTPEVVALID